ncbi:MAG TPA: hypothetical protein VFV08_07540, partial [Puia sp.]|nr:hypothetical protein [Puia sp.]
MRCFGTVKYLLGITIIVLFVCLKPTPGYSQQDTTKELPNGTDGLLFQPRVADSTFVNKKSDLA